MYSTKGNIEKAFSWIWFILLFAKSLENNYNRCNLITQLLASPRC